MLRLNTEVHASFVISVFVFLGYIPRVELRVVLFSFFFWKLHTVFHSGYTHLISCQQYMRIPFSHPHQYVICALSDDRHTDKSEAISHCGFSFPVYKNVYSFLSLISKSSCFWMLSCMSYLYRLCINPLLVISFANIFSNSVDCLSFCQCLPLL